MIATDQATVLMDRGEVVGSEGGTIGKVGQVYVDSETGQLTWLTVKTGWFGSNESFVPLDDATVNGNTVTVPYDKATVKGAPHHEVGAELSIQDEDDLYAYYGVRHGDVAFVDTDVSTSEAPLRQTSTDGFLTRSEERLRVGTQQVEVGRARLKKFVVTEQQTVTVPVSHEEVEIVREAIAPGDFTGATIGEDAIEITLMEHEVVIDKDVVAVEKVKLGTEIVTEDRAVTGTVRREQVELHTDTVDSATDFTGDATVEPGTAGSDTVGHKAQGLVDKAKNALS